MRAAPTLVRKETVKSDMDYVTNLICFQPDFMVALMAQRSLFVGQRHTPINNLLA